MNVKRKRQSRRRRGSNAEGKEDVGGCFDGDTQEINTVLKEVRKERKKTCI